MKRRYGSLYAMVTLAIALLVGMAGMGYATPAYVPPGKNPANYPGAAATPVFDNSYLVPDLFGSTPNWNLSPSLTKFVNELAPLGCATTNNIGQCLPVAVPDIVTYPGSDYYEIELNQYTEKLHTELGPTTLRGYRQTNNGTATGCTDPALNQANPCTLSNNTVAPTAAFHFLGPIIVAQKDRPVRVKLTNNLPTGTAGNLFVPVDTTLMGSGRGPLKSDGTACSFVDVPGVTTPFKENGPDCASYPQNRAEIHLHGGLSPWISDGTPHQWVTPAGEVTPFKRGASTQNVPDMADPGDGSITYYYTNQQSARLLFYHDHAVGLTRLNVYAGEVAGYLIRDAVEQDLITRGIIPVDEIPLIVMDKGFVDPATIAQLDPTWAWGTGADNGNGTRVPVNGDLWWPHVYMPAENPADITGVNPMGRWVYGLWFWPPTTGIPYQLTPNPYYDPACEAGPTAPGCVTEHAFEPPTMPKTPNPSWVAEAFMDTMLINGTAYPTLTVDPKAYRFRILNGAHDRFLNLQLYEATTTLKNCTISGGSGFAVGDLITFQGGHRAVDSTHKYPQDAEASVVTVDAGGGITAIRMDNYGSHYQAAPTSILTDGIGAGATFACTLQADTEVAMVPAVSYPEYAPLNKQYAPVDSRDGGVPDPTTAGPNWIQIGSESGFLAKPAILPNYPVTFLLDPTLFNVGNVVDGTLRMGPAERADVIIDFCQYAGKTLILYNDAPAAYPAAVANNDYYTGSPDLRDAGGHAGVLPGMSPNTRTVMQIKVNAGGCANYNLAALQNEFTKSTAPGGFSVFEKAQEPLVVGQAYYNDAYGVTFPGAPPGWGVSEIGDNYLSYFDPTTITGGTGVPAVTPMQPKAIHDEMGAVYDDYGRMSARLGVEVPGTTNLNQSFVMQGYIDPPTEIVDDGQVQIWKITHNGVDTHPMHFHLFDVQVINRVGWDGFKRLPDDNERGWKETLKVSPLEDTIVAFRPRAPKTPFGLPNSIRKLAPGLPDSTTQGFTNLQTSGPQTGQAKNPLDTNVAYNFGDEYVWHCHILSHEEQDMMRPIRFNTTKTTPNAPSGLSGSNAAGTISLTWVDPTPRSAFSPTAPSDPRNEIGFEIVRCAGSNCTNFVPVGTALANATTYQDMATSDSSTYRYQVMAYNAAGTSAASNIATVNVGPVNGVCGSANGQNVSVVPTTGLCTTGAASSVINTNGSLGWTCAGINGGTSSPACTAQIPTYSVSFTAGAGGAIQGTTPQTVTYNLSASTVTAVPNPGYQFTNWTVGAVPVTTNPVLTVTNVVSALAYTANFAPLAGGYNLIFKSGVGGTITGATPQQIAATASATTVTAVPNAGVSFINWTDDLGNIVSTLPALTIVNPVAAHTYTANFGFSVALGNCITGPAQVVAGSIPPPTYNFTAAGFDLVAAYLNGTQITTTAGSYTFPAGLNDNQVITASYVINPVGTAAVIHLINGASTINQTVLQTAYGNAATGNTLQMKAVTLGGLTANRNIILTLKGGYNDAYSANCGYSTLQGGLTVRRGTIVADNIIIK